MSYAHRVKPPEDIMQLSLTDVPGPEVKEELPVENEMYGLGENPYISFSTGSSSFKLTWS